MDEFNRPGSDVFIYLLTTRAGVSILPVVWVDADLTSCRVLASIYLYVYRRIECGIVLIIDT